MKILSYLSVCILFLASCQSAPELNFPSGNWVFNTEEGVSIVEIWTEEGSGYIGTGSIIRNDKMLNQEDMELVYENESWLYKTTVHNQNNGETIAFKLVEQTDNLWRFENPDHDFPQYLEYTLTADNALVAEIGSLNELVKQQFYFVKSGD